MGVWVYRIIADPDVEFEFVGRDFRGLVLGVIGPGVIEPPTDSRGFSNFVAHSGAARASSYGIHLEVGCPAVPVVAQVLEAYYTYAASTYPR